MRKLFWAGWLVVSVLPLGASSAFFIEDEVGERNYYTQVSFSTIKNLQSLNIEHTIVDSNLNPVKFAIANVIKKAEAAELPLKEVKGSLRAYAYEVAKKYKINPERFVKTMECESGFDEKIQSNILKKGGPNGREDSWGVAQIHLPAHPSVSRAEATNGKWALEWAAEKFKKNPRIWTCYRMHYGK